MTHFVPQIVASPTIVGWVAPLCSISRPSPTSSRGLVLTKATIPFSSAIIPKVAHRSHLATQRELLRRVDDQEVFVQLFAAPGALNFVSWRMGFGRFGTEFVKVRHFSSGLFLLDGRVRTVDGVVAIVKNDAVRSNGELKVEGDLWI
jgi:hypothetical protein